MIEITQAETPPRHLVLGAWRVDAVARRFEERRREFEACRARGAAADHDDA